MMTFIPPRLRKPGIYALAGLLFSAAWLVQGGRLGWVSIPALIGTVAGTVRLYRVGGTDTDEGARIGSRTAITSFIGLTAAVVRPPVSS